MTPYCKPVKTPVKELISSKNTPKKGKRRERERERERARATTTTTTRAAAEEISTAEIRGALLAANLDVVRATTMLTVLAGPQIKRLRLNIDGDFVTDSEGEGEGGGKEEESDDDDDDGGLPHKAPRAPGSGLDGARVLGMKHPAVANIFNPGPGRKDIENRSRHLPPHLLGKKIYLQGSRNTATAAQLADTAARRERAGGERQALPKENGRNGGGQGSLVGYIIISASKDTSSSPWYNGAPDKAWVISEAVKFDHPVDDIRGYQTPLVFLKTHEDRDRIVAGLAANGIPLEDI